MPSTSPMLGQLVAPTPRAGAPIDQNAGQYPAAAAPVTFGIWMRASVRITPPDGGWKSVRCVSMRPDVQLPAPSRIGLTASLPSPVRYTFAVLLVSVSTSPVPQLPAPPG